jgi:hypothetical protein
MHAFSGKQEINEKEKESREEKRKNWQPAVTTTALVLL